jgi:uncharacterized protein (TIGR00661 family)
MASHLLEQGHEVRLVSYDRGYENLKHDFDVFQTEGLCIASIDNKVSVVKTFTENLKRLPKGHEKLQELRQTLFRDFQPACVVTDFEPMTAYLAGHYDLPLISIDNQHRMRYMKFPYPKGLKVDRRVTKNIIRAMVPHPDVALVTTFYFGKVKNDRTFLFPPILRREVLQRSPQPGEHILVYVTGEFSSLLGVLQAFTRESFLVYGYDREDTDGVLAFRRFSKAGFLDDLAAARAVIATAGFTLLSEALYLHKPYLALPMRGQFEQQLNGYQLHELGYGRCLRAPTPEAVAEFLYHVPDFASRLEAYDPGDNTAIKEKLDELLADDCALARQFHEGRR